MISLKRGILWGVLIATLLGVAGASAWSSFAGQKMVTVQITPVDSAPTGTPELLADYGAVPDFQLTDRSGKPLRLSDLQGRPWVANFIFTRCGGQCPMMSSQMSQLQGNVKDGDARFVSFTVDPEYDTLEILSKYAERYGAKKEKWFFLTGSKEEINRLTQAFHMNSTEEPSFHSLRFVLVGSDLRVRGYYDSSDKEAREKLLKDLTVLTRGV